MIRKAIIVVLTTPAIVLTVSGTWSYWRPVELVDASRVRVGTEGGVAYLRIYYSCDHILQLRTVRWVGFTWYEQEMILPNLGGVVKPGAIRLHGGFCFAF